jgi:hypothetical protein
MQKSQRENCRWTERERGVPDSLSLRMGFSGLFSEHTRGAAKSQRGRTEGRADGRAGGRAGGRRGTRRASASGGRAPACREHLEPVALAACEQLCGV